ncbi:hypothetical protein DR73_1541 [Enterobacteriaceae bacterium ATCC 29904]|nr:hypothetical protein DR73_1541 [Enterobacteriaceae bacterium ATCC 29904]
MSSLLLLKCTKDTEGWWTEGERYPARVVTGGFVLLGDDDELDGEGWSAGPIEHSQDGSILYQIGGLDGEVLFEEAAQ